MKQRKRRYREYGLDVLKVFFCITTAVALLLAGTAMGAESKSQVLKDPLQLDIPQPQFFCGSCHVLTYPGIFQKSYDTWKESKHQNANCVDCHYPPKTGEKQKQSLEKDVAAEKKHISENPPERFSYIPIGGETVKTRPRIDDAGCMTAACHGNPKDQFKTKKIKFAEKAVYVHQPHLDIKNQIKGQKVNCTTCHQHDSEKKHFEVSKATCFLCHFKNTTFAEGRSKCTLCHKLPEKPIQTSGDKPITHQMLQEAKVQCGNCHYDLIRGGGQIRYELVIEAGQIKNAQIMGGGRIKLESCSNCHDQASFLKESANQKLMHEQHVTIKNSRCFDCHNPIFHEKADIEKPSSIRKACMTCHPDHHKFQELLIKGPKRSGVSHTPDPMLKVRTNCLGCHIERGIGQKGEPTLKASGKTCVACHTKEHDKMLKSWTEELSREMEDALALEADAKETLAEFKETLSKEDLYKFRKMLKDGQRFWPLRIRPYGGLALVSPWQRIQAPVATGA